MLPTSKQGFQEPRTRVVECFSGFRACTPMKKLTRDMSAKSPEMFPEMSREFPEHVQEMS